MDLSVIIVNFRTFKLTVDCIHSILENSKGLNLEIIVVDNAAKEDINLDFRNIFPDIIYIRSQINLGFGSANNLGISIAKGKYILLINSDTIMLDNCSNKCFQYMEINQNDNIGLIGCK